MIVLWKSYIMLKMKLLLADSESEASLSIVTKDLVEPLSPGNQLG